MLIVTLASVGIFLAVSGNLNVSGNLLPLIVVAGVSLWCVQNRKSNDKMGESCFLISIYFLSVLLSKMLDIKEKFNTPTLPSAAEVNAAVATYSNWGQASIDSTTEGIYELYYISLNIALEQADGKLITAFVEDPSIFQSVYENNEVKSLIEGASVESPITSTELRNLLEKVIANSQKIQNTVPAEATLLEYYKKILNHIKSNPNILLRLASASTPALRVAILKEIMVPYQDLISNTASQYGVSQEQINNIQNRVLQSLEKNSDVLNYLLKNLNNLNNLNTPNLQTANIPSFGELLNCNNVSNGRQIVQQNYPESLASYNNYVRSACTSEQGNNGQDKPIIIGELARQQAVLDELNSVNLGVGAIAGIATGSIVFVVICILVGIYISKRPVPAK